MGDDLLIIAAIFIEIGIPIVLIALIYLYKEWRRYTIVQLASVIPWLVFYLLCTIYNLLNPNASEMGLGFIFEMSFIFYCFTFVLGCLFSPAPYPQTLKFRFVVGLTSPFLLYGFRGLWIVAG